MDVEGRTEPGTVEVEKVVRKDRVVALVALVALVAPAILVALDGFAEMEAALSVFEKKERSAHSIVVGTAVAAVKRVAAAYSVEESDSVMLVRHLLHALYCRCEHDARCRARQVARQQPE